MTSKLGCGVCIHMFVFSSTHSKAVVLCEKNSFAVKKTCTLLKGDAKLFKALVEAQNDS